MHIPAKIRKRANIIDNTIIGPAIHLSSTMNMKENTMATTSPLGTMI